MGVLCPFFKALLISLYIAFLLVSLFLNLASAQEPLTPGLSVGQTVPEKVWAMTLVDISGPEGKLLRMGDYRGKPLIIDFFASWCHPCLSNMQKLDSLSKLKGSSFNVLIVNTPNRIDSLKNMRAFISGYLKDKPAFSLPIVAAQRDLFSFFPHRVVPNYIWIGADGTIKAITGSEEVSSLNTKRFVAGETMFLKTKTD